MLQQQVRHCVCVHVLVMRVCPQQEADQPVQQSIRVDETDGGTERGGGEQDIPLGPEHKHNTDWVNSESII